MNAEVEKFIVALEEFCSALSTRIVHLADDEDLDSLDMVLVAIRDLNSKLVNLEHECEWVLNRA